MKNEKNKLNLPTKQDIEEWHVFIKELIRKGFFRNFLDELTEFGIWDDFYNFFSMLIKANFPEFIPEDFDKVSKFILLHELIGPKHCLYCGEISNLKGIFLENEKVKLKCVKCKNLFKINLKKNKH